MNRAKITQGNIPVSLIACHAGDYQPQDIPDNAQARFGRGRADLFTGHFAEEVAAALAAWNVQPNLVIADIARSKVDLNDEPGRAYVGAGRQIYEAFHTAVAQACLASLVGYRWSLVLDLHGFSPRTTHPARDRDIILGTANGRSLPLDGPTGLSRNAFSGFLVSRGWQVYPAGCAAEDIFPGGYIIRSYSRPRANQYAVQIEISAAVRQNQAQRKQLAGDLAEWIWKLLSGLQVDGDL